MISSLKAFCIGIAVFITFGVGSVSAAEYLLTGHNPDQLVLIDAKARKIERSYTVPDVGNGILTITPSRDGKRAYAIVNRWESVSGIDLDTGEQVFRANFSSRDIRVKAIFAMDISPDGKELFVLHSPVKLGVGEYEVQDTYVAVYNTADGLDAKPVRKLPVPRRTAILIMSDDGSKLYAASWDIYVIDPQTGEQIDIHRARTWGRENMTEPDILDVWPQWEQANVFSTPYFSVRTDKSEEDPAAYAMGMLTLDLKTDEFVMEEYENFAAIIFSTVVNPVRRNEVYGVYTTLSKIDIEKDELVKRQNLDHTYYAINVSSDGEELYVGGTMDDIAIYDTETFEKIGEIRMPNGGDMVLASLRMVQR
ncbi:MAG: quinohemoprotein amine dehydrogenase subunit beta [Gammaproteobacteria bacterium]|nr:quinohemoprotein amine dehydrogenase subunit beta [Gammaproteobacteria bacterium]